MSVIEVFYKSGYGNKWGLFEDSPGARSQNVMRWTDDVLTSAKAQGKPITIEQRRDFIDALQKYEYKPGVLRRFPEHGYDIAEQDSPDNYISRIHISHLLNDGFCRRFLDHGRTNKFAGIIPYHYRNAKRQQHPFSAFIGRQYQIVAAAKMIEGEPLNWFDEFSIKLALNYAVISKQQDSKCLGWKLKDIVIHDQRFHKQCVNFEMNLAQTYGGVGQVLKRYLTDKDNPSIDYLWGLI